jgi:hypothetical protein
MLIPYFVISIVQDLDRARMLVDLSRKREKIKRDILKNKCTFIAQVTTATLQAPQVST